MTKQKVTGARDGVSDPIKVLYIAGTGRSGSTLLANVLGSTDGLFAAGEIRYLWERGLVRGGPCGCGQPVPDCSLWDAVLKIAYDNGIDGTKMAEVGRENMRLRRLPSLLMRLRYGNRRSSSALADYSECLRQLYPAIAEVAGATVIVDSSKLLPYAVILDTIPGVELYVLHLVRDPRAAAHSWLRGPASGAGNEELSGDQPMARFSPLKSSALWLVWNTIIAALWRNRPRYLLLRYEEFVADPVNVMERILRFVDTRPTSLPFLDDRTATIAVNHSVAGNPNRHRSGNVVIREDDEWRTRLSLRRRVLVTAITAPILHHMGYRPFRMARDWAAE